MITLEEYINKSTDCWHSLATTEEILKDSGYIKLSEGENWKLERGKKYFVTRNMSSLVAFEIPESIQAFMISAAHGESPSFKIKAIPSIKDKNYIRLSTELYGGPILSSWLDRPLSVSGRVIVEVNGALEQRLVNLDRNSLIIPSLAPHINKDKELKVSRDLIPLYALSGSADFMTEIAYVLNVNKDNIKGFDLMLYNRERAYVWGKENEFISAPRLDDLQCAYALLKAFVNSENSKACKVYCLFDNEEVGSGTKQGARSDLLISILKRICEELNISYSEYMQILSSSFMVSADNGHAIHPNRPEASDSNNYPVLNGGVVIKYNASQKYTTDAVSEAIFKMICQKASVPYQVYANQSDIAGGSTLGNLAAEKLCINMIDVGLSQLAMHSSLETAGFKDTDYMTLAITAFYNSLIKIENQKIYIE